MHKSVESFLPDYLKQSTCASVEVDSSVLDSAPNIVILNSDGNMYEVRARKIVNSLNLHKETGQKVLCAYLVENEKLAIFYLVLTNKNRLLIIKRLDFRLEVIDVYENVSSFEVHDFFCLGYPQIRITSEKDSIIKFPVEDTKAVVYELEFERNSNSITKSLAEKLQIVCRHVDELSEEWYNARNLHQFNTHKDFSLLPIECVKFLLPLEKRAEKITITAKWIKVMGLKLILGVKILYDCKMLLSDLEFKMIGEVIKDYSYRFFLSHDDSTISNNKNMLFSCEKALSSVQPGREITVVGVVSVDFLNFPFKKTFQISCYLASAKLKSYLLREIFEINISDMVDYSNKFFHSLNETFSVEDLQVIKTVKSETKLQIKTRNSTIDSLATLLEKSLGFIKLESAKGKLYYCSSTYLSEVFVAVQLVAESVWKIILYTSDDTQIYFFANMLYELLPEYTIILLDEG